MLLILCDLLPVHSTRKFSLFVVFVMYHTSPVELIGSIRERIVVVHHKLRGPDIWSILFTSGCLILEPLLKN